MKMIPRPLYLDRLVRWRDHRTIKVLSGVRRCGKSTLLTLFAEHLAASGVPSDRIIRLNFEDLAWESLKDYRALHRYISERLTDDAMTYVFLDEVQEVPQFERAVDSLFLHDNVDLYLTGSNAYFMSSELTTLLSGRYVEISMLPLSFTEYCSSLEVDTTSSAALAQAYRRYSTEGGFPYTLNLVGQPEALQDYLQSIFNSIVIKDVVARHRVTDVMMLEDVTRYLLDNVGNILSSTRVAGAMTSAGRPINQRTVEKYVKAFTQGLLFYEARRFDVKGKRLLERMEKLYVVDLGLRQAILGGRGLDTGHLLENVVYLELLRRGYQVFVGQAGVREIDFIATRADDRLYLQVTATTRDTAVLERELAPLATLTDSYPKLVLTLDDDPPGDYEGIRRLNALTWLLQSA